MFKHYYLKRALQHGIYCLEQSKLIKEVFNIYLKVRRHGKNS